MRQPAHAAPIKQAAQSSRRRARRAEKTKWGRELSGALIATLCGLLLSNVGVIAADAPQYAIVNGYLLPLAIPMLLFSADLQRVIRDTGQLLPVFVVGAAATVLATLAAIAVVPLSPLGPNGWKIAAALCARHIGGAINYVAVTVATNAGQAAVSAGLAADNLICAIYFSSLYALARRIPAEQANLQLSAQAAGDSSAYVAEVCLYDNAQMSAIAKFVPRAGMRAVHQRCLRRCQLHSPREPGYFM